MKKKFDFEDKTKTATVIDCMDCEHYYTGACDARAGGCNSYEPTRKITMAEDIKTIKRRQNIMFGVMCVMYALLGAIYVAIH